MALTVRTNGSATINIITASWFNDYYNLLTGAMSDQVVTINNTVVVKAITYTTPTAPTLALHAGTSMGIGSYTYGVTFVEAPGQTVLGTTATITTTTGNQQVNLTAIPLGPTGTTARNIFRSKVGTTAPLFRVTTLSDNTTTTFLDTVADGSLGGLTPAHDLFGGLVIQNQGGSSTGVIYNDGYSNLKGVGQFLASPYTLLSNVSINNGVTSTQTVTGIGTFPSNIPTGISAVWINALYNSASLGANLSAYPHGVTYVLPSWPLLGNIQNTGLSAYGNAWVPVSAGGQVDFTASGANLTGIYVSIMGYMW